MKAFKLKGFLALVAAVLLVGGCSTFNRDWRAAAGESVEADSIAGRWEGRWRSEANGHSGELRCLVSAETNGVCRARFHATYARVFHFTYTVPFTVQKHFGGWEFNGEENLGKFAGGVYDYEGRASPTNFFSTYRAQHDHGVFEMHRPP